MGTSPSMDRLRFPNDFIGTSEADFNAVYSGGNPIVGSDEGSIVWSCEVWPYMVTLARFDGEWVCEMTNQEDMATGIAQAIGRYPLEALRESVRLYKESDRWRNDSQSSPTCATATTT